MEYVKFTDIKPAAYNPRKISEVAFEELQGSLRTLGFILPIIVNKDNMTIVAGHQRTKAAKAVGLDCAPAYLVQNIDIESEILFNQIHNGIEMEPKEHSKFIGKRETDKFYEDLRGEEFEVKETNAVLVNEMSKLIVKFGDALCAIVCGDEVVFGNNYIKAAICLNIPIHCYILDGSHKQEFDYYFGKDYGVFCYDHLERKDFVQGLAQPPRSGGVKWSVLYRTVVNPMLKKHEAEKEDFKILDFGCGKALFINKLKKEVGYRKSIGLEFFNHNRVGISIEKGHEMIDKFFAFYKKYGKFDFTICDAVVNSVNTQKAEDYVFTILNLVTKMGGTICVSGRSKEHMLKNLNMKKSTTDVINVKFFDDNGLTGCMFEGQWFYQKFLTKEQVDKIFDKFGFKCEMRYLKTGYWGFGATKVRELSKEEYIAAVDYEFNLNLPNKQSYNRHEEAKEVFGLNK